MLQLKELGFIDLMNAISKDEKMTLALPKGRILEEVLPLLEKAGIKPEDSFVDSNSRKLKYSTNEKYLDLISVRSFDVATFVAFGAAQLGIAGDDVVQEFDYSEVYAPLNLNIGHCRLCLAAPMKLLKNEDPSSWSNIRVATKYPNLTKRFFADRGVQVDPIKLNKLNFQKCLGTFFQHWADQNN